MSNSRNHTRGKRLGRATQRRGVFTLELILALPVLLIVILAIVQFSMLLMSAQAVSAAASVAAREATLPGMTHHDVTQATKRALTGWKFADAAEVYVQVNGFTSSELSLSESTTGDLVEVTVYVPSIEAAPDLLKFFGLSIKDHSLMTTFVMRKE